MLTLVAPCRRARACTACAQEAPASERAMLVQQLEPLRRVAKAHASGPQAYARSVVIEVLALFPEVEEKFQSSSGVTTEQEMIDALRKMHPNNHQVRGRCCAGRWQQRACTPAAALAAGCRRSGSSMHGSSTCVCGSRRSWRRPACSVRGAS